jgi:uncharacterized membrane protein YbhN (UPF0104 family)
MVALEVVQAGWRPAGRSVGWALLAVVAVGVLAVLLGSGEATRTISGALQALTQVDWIFIPVMAALVVAHFWLSAVALRGAAGVRLPLAHATMAQFTAAAANRATGGGLGTVAVNARYLSGQGVPAAKAMAMAGVLQAAGALADLLLFALVLPIVVMTGGGMVLGEFWDRFSGPLPLVAAVAATFIAAAAFLFRDRLKEPLAACAELIRRPGDLLVMLIASAGTTLAMGLAFAAALLAIPGAADPSQLATLVAIYMIAAAAGGVVPGPGGLGSTEAALIGLLAMIGTDPGTALPGVLIFRALTHWAPVPIGLLAAGTLRRHQPPVGPAAPVGPAVPVGSTVPVGSAVPVGPAVAVGRAVPVGRAISLGPAASVGPAVRGAVAMRGPGRGCLVKRSVGSAAGGGGYGFFGEGSGGGCGGGA